MASLRYETGVNRNDRGLTLRPGTLVVFEGLDRVGKLTQVDALRELNWGAPAPTFAHMPSGSSSLRQAIYRLTEREAIDSPLCRQLLHLACHAESQPFLRAARASGGLILDRWWWSTVAYGWATGALADAGLSEDAFFGRVARRRRRPRAPLP